MNDLFLIVSKLQILSRERFQIRGWQTFPVKDRRGDMFGFAGHRVFVSTTQLM